MKRIWFVSFGLLFGRVLAGCSGQVDFPRLPPRQHLP